MTGFQLRHRSGSAWTITLKVRQTDKPLDGMWNEVDRIVAKLRQEAPSPQKARRTIGLVSCTKTKLEHPASARDLYSRSDLFQKAARYCEVQYDEWFVLSAKHGLVRPAQVIEPYDVSLKTMSRREQHEWGRQVAEQLRELGDAEFEIHAGLAYTWPLEDAGIELRKPLEGLSIGKRKQWYLRQERVQA